MRRFFILSIVLACFLSASTRAHALDKRLKLMFKTAGYGAAAGLVVGAGTAALGLGGFRNALMGASSGMYAGIVLAAYIVSTKEEGRPSHRMQNPYAPKRPVSPDEFEEGDEEDFKENLPPRREDRDESRVIPESGTTPLRLAARSFEGLDSTYRGYRETGVWMPVVSLHW